MVATAGQPRQLLELKPAELERALVPLGAQPYRARQVFRWLHRRGELDPRNMSDLPQGLRDKLAEAAGPPPLTLAATAVSTDGSIKHGWRTVAGHPVESVLMPGFDYGCAACLSSHSGCPLRCAFCATGRLGLRARLSAAEMLAQLYLAEAQAQLTAERVVFMGMGEPLLNLAAVQRCVELLCLPAGRAWSPRRITVSTVGLVKPLVALATSFPRVNLALSLHFTAPEKRSEHMPGAESDLPRLQEALHYYRRVNGGKITLEYLLLAGLNDGERDARRLAAFARLADVDLRGELALDAQQYPEPARQQALPLHVNLIEYNPIPAAPYTPAAPQQLDDFAARLVDLGIPVSVRHSRGRDVGAACGMLGAQL